VFLVDIEAAGLPVALVDATEKAPDDLRLWTRRTTPCPLVSG
jgi:hypothetical protein